MILPFQIHLYGEGFVCAALRPSLMQIGNLRGQKESHLSGVPFRPAPFAPFAQFPGHTTPAIPIAGFPYSKDPSVCHPCR